MDNKYCQKDVNRDKMAPSATATQQGFQERVFNQVGPEYNGGTTSEEQECSRNHVKVLMVNQRKKKGA